MTSAKPVLTAQFGDLQFWKKVLEIEAGARAQNRSFWTWEEWDRFFAARHTLRLSERSLLVHCILATKARVDRAKADGLTAAEFADDEDGRKRAIERMARERREREIVEARARREAERRRNAPERRKLASAWDE